MDLTHPALLDNVGGLLNCVDVAALAACSKAHRSHVGPRAESAKADLVAGLERLVADFRRARDEVDILEGDPFDLATQKRFWVAMGAAKQSDEWTHEPTEQFPHRVKLGDVCVEDVMQPCPDVKHELAPDVALFVEPFQMQLDEKRGDSGDGDRYTVFFQVGWKERMLGEHWWVEAPSSPPLSTAPVGRGDAWFVAYREHLEAEAKSIAHAQAVVRFEEFAARRPSRFVRFVESQLDVLFEIEM